MPDGRAEPPPPESRTSEPTRPLAYESRLDPVERVWVFSRRQHRRHESIRSGGSGLLGELYDLACAVVRWHCRRERIRIVVEEKPPSLAESLACQRRETVPPAVTVEVPVPSLVETLARAERDAGRPLSEAEVVALCRVGPRVAMSPEWAAKVAAKRGYDDLDPARAWAQWQAIRGSLAVRGHAETKRS